MDTTIVILLGTVAAIAVIALFWRLGVAGSSRKQGSFLARHGERLSTLAWEPEPVRVLDRHHRRVFERLRSAMPEYIVLAQVPLSRFLKVGRRRSYVAWLGKVGQDCAHFLVCSAEADVLVVIELRTGNASASAQRRRDRVEKVLRQADLAVVVWDHLTVPSVEVIRTTLRTIDLSRRGTAGETAPAPLGS